MERSLNPVLLAVELVEGGADVVVVGGTAEHLRGGTHRPRDLDVVVEPASVAGLVGVLADLGVAVRERALQDGRAVHLATGWGPLDVFVAPRPASVEVCVDDRAVTAATR